MRAFLLRLLPWALGALVLLPARDAGLTSDTVRDLSASLQLALGEAFPLAGPPINFGPRIGPAWPWLQALPLVVSHRLADVAWFVAAIGALRIVLLAELGRMWGGPRMGACVAIAAALPSVGVFHWFLFFHPDWVEAGIALTLLCALLSWRRASIRWWYGAAFALGFAVQMHPTAIFYGPVLAITLAHLRSGGRARLVHGLGAFLAVAMWFAPIAFEAQLDQVHALRFTTMLVGRGVDAFDFGEVLTVLATAYVRLPWAIVETYAPAAHLPVQVCHVLLLAGWAGMAAGALSLAAWGTRGEKLAATAVVATLLLGWTIATAVRTYTSFYLAYFLLPLSTLLQGVLLERAFMARWRASRPLAALSAGAALIVIVSTTIGAWQVGRQDFLETRILGFGDLRHAAAEPQRLRLVGARARDAIAEHFCAQPAAFSAHGDLALARAASLDLDDRLHCPAHPPSRILGTDNAWTVVTVDEAARLGRNATALSGTNLALFPLKAAITGGAGRPIEGDWYQFDYPRDAIPMTHVDLRFATAPGDAVMVFKVKVFARWENLRVTRDGKPAMPVGTTIADALYASGPEPAEWRVEVDTTTPHWLDVHVF